MAYVSRWTRARSTAADVARRPIAKWSTASVLEVGRSASRREAMSNEQRTPRNVERSTPELGPLLAPFSDEEIANGVTTPMPSKHSGGAPRSTSMICSERSGSGAPRGPPIGLQRDPRKAPPAMDRGACVLRSGSVPIVGLVGLGAASADLGARTGVRHRFPQQQEAREAHATAAATRPRDRRRDG